MTERDIELRTIGRFHQSGFGPGSDICEMIWEVLAEYDIHPDGVTMLPEVIRSLCEDKLTVDELTSQALVI